MSTHRPIHDRTDTRSSKNSNEKRGRIIRVSWLKLKSGGEDFGLRFPLFLRSDPSILNHYTSRRYDDHLTRGTTDPLHRYLLSYHEHTYVGPTRRIVVSRRCPTYYYMSVSILKNLNSLLWERLIVFPRYHRSSLVPESLYRRFHGPSEKTSGQKGCVSD